MATTAPKGVRRIFNLLRPYVGPESAWDKIYNWIVVRARLVMVIVELMLIVVFFFKVFVDIQAGAYNLQIGDNQKRYDPLVKSVYPTANQTQQKASSYMQLWNNASSYAAILNEVSAFVGSSGSEVSIRISKDGLNISGNMSLQQISQVEQKIKGDGDYAAAQVGVSTEVSESGTTGDYTLNAVIVDTKNREQL